MSRSAPLRQRVTAVILLVCGIGLAAALTTDALTGSIDSDDAISAGTAPVVDPASIELPADRVAPVRDGPTTLVLFDPALETGDVLEHDPELSAILMANLAGHFGPVSTQLVDEYRSGDGAQFSGVVYVGAYGDDFGDNRLPDAFLEDVLQGAIDVLWLGAGSDQLARAADDFPGVFGWSPEGATRKPSQIDYEGVRFERPTESLPVHPIEVVDADMVDVLATSTSGELELQPYAVRSRNLIYVAEVPFGFLAEANHSLVVADLLFDLLEPDRTPRHRAMVRLEDIGPTSDPVALLEAGEALAARDVPFSIAVYPIWRDPLSQYQLGRDIRLAERPELVAVLEKLQRDFGATIVMHGVTHQYSERPNPFSGVSAEDFEFYTTRLDDDDRVRPVGPVPEDSQPWVRDRIRRGFAEFEAAGLDTPSVFVFPHYLGSPNSYQAVEPIFAARYEQGTYFPGMLSGEPMTDELRAQFFPYPVRDLWGEIVLPESLGNVIVEGLNRNDVRQPMDLIAAAERTLVVRDGVASFYFHPYLPLDFLVETVDGITALGYEFVSPAELLDEW